MDGGQTDGWVEGGVGRWTDTWVDERTTLALPREGLKVGGS